MHHPRVVLFTLGITLLLSWNAAAFAQPRANGLRVIAKTGQAAPGTAAGVTYSGLNAPRVDADANTTFGAFLAGPNITQGHMGIWVERDGALELVIQRGDPAPGAGPGVTFTTTGFSPLNPAIADGLVAFRSPLLTPGGVGGGLFKETPLDLRLVALGGMQAPGLPAGVTMGVGEPAFNPPGNVVFGSFLSGTGITANNDESIWTDRAGPLALLVREGNRAPGTTLVFGAGSSRFAPGGLREFTTNAQSRVLVHANLSGRGVDDLNDEALYVEGPNGLALLAREGAQAPGQATGIRFGAGVGDAFDEIVPLVLSNAGVALFQARIAGANVNATFADTLWTNRSGAPRLLVRGRSLGSTPKGDPAPGFANRTFLGFTNFARINQTSRVAFVGVVEGAPGTTDSDFGIFSDRAGALALVVGDGTPVGDQPGVLFGRTTATNSYELLALNDSNHVYFTTAVRGAVPAGTAGLFVSAPSGQVRTVLQTGDAIDLTGDGSDVRTLSTFFVGGVNRDGVIALSLFFSDFTQAIVTVQ